MESCNNSWIFNLLSYASFKDLRLVKRFGLILEMFIQRPAASIPEACVSWAATKGAYRFFTNKKVDSKEIRDMFFAYTSDQIKNQKIVLILNDTTEVSYGAHKKIKVGGYVGSPDSNGVFLHSALVLNDSMTPAGLLYQKHWYRDIKDYGKGKESHKNDIEKKESYCWIEVVKASQERIPENVTSIIIGDRGADIYELFIEKRRINCHLLVRAAYNRNIVSSEHKYLFDAVNAQKPSAIITITVRGSKHQTRAATLEIRHTLVNIKRSLSVSKKILSQIPLSIISAKEIGAPDGEKSIEWKLLTSLMVDSAETAIQCVEYYAKRWVIERYHFVLKSGCRVEELQLESSEGIERALAIYCIVAWRLLHMTYLARVEPDISCAKTLSDDEWRALCCFVAKQKLPPKEPPTLANAILMIAKLGGFLARKSDGNPGLEVIWRGLRRLEDITETYTIFAKPIKCG